MWSPNFECRVECIEKLSASEIEDGRERSSSGSNGFLEETQFLREEIVRVEIGESVEVHVGECSNREEGCVEESFLIDPIEHLCFEILQELFVDSK